MILPFLSGGNEQMSCFLLIPKSNFTLFEISKSSPVEFIENLGLHVDFLISCWL